MRWTAGPNSDHSPDSAAETTAASATHHRAARNRRAEPISLPQDAITPALANARNAAANITSRARSAASSRARRVHAESATGLRGAITNTINATASGSGPMPRARRRRSRRAVAGERETTLMALRRAAARAASQLPHTSATTLAGGQSPSSSRFSACPPRRAGVSARPVVGRREAAVALLPGAHRVEHARRCPSGRDRARNARLAIRVGVALAIARLGGSAAAAAHPLVTGLHGPGLLAAGIVEVAFDGRRRPPQALGNLRDRQTL